MALFHCVYLDKCVQVDDKFRLDASNSYVSPDEEEITTILVDMGDGTAVMDVTQEGYADYQYDTPGTYTITVTIQNSTSFEDKEYTIEVKTPEADCLLADDDCLLAFEPTIRKLLSCERCSFNHIHRQVKVCIDDCLREWALIGKDCKYLSVEDLKDSPEIKKWATYWALELIYEGVSNQTDDIFSQKAAFYRSKRVKAGNINNIHYDKDGDGIIEAGEKRVVCRRIIRK